MYPSSTLSNVNFLTDPCFFRIRQWHVIPFNSALVLRRSRCVGLVVRRISVSNFFGAGFSVPCRSFCSTDSTELLCRILDPFGTGSSFSSSSAFRLRCPFVLTTDNSAVVVLSLVAADNEVFIAPKFAFVKVVTAGAVTLAGFASALVERVLCKVST